jgi:hypothetical protein
VLDGVVVIVAVAAATVLAFAVGVPMHAVKAACQHTMVGVAVDIAGALLGRCLFGAAAHNDPEPSGGIHQSHHQPFVLCCTQARPNKSSQQLPAAHVSKQVVVLNGGR